MDIKQLEYFLAVANARSFSRASELIPISQPALSRQIRLLEEELGGALFERHRHGVTVTETGAALAESAKNIVQQIRSVTERAKSLATEPNGALAFAIPPSLRRLLTTKLTAQFHTQYPNVLLSIFEGPTFATREMVAKEQVELAVISTIDSGRDLQLDPLITEKLYLVGPVDASLNEKRSISVARLAAVPLIATPTQNSLRQIVDNALQSERLASDVRIETTTVDMMLQLIADGVGYTVLPYCAVAEAVKTKQVRVAPIRGMSISWAVAARADRPLSTAAKVFKSLLWETAESQVAKGHWKVEAFHHYKA